MGVTLLSTVSRLIRTNFAFIRQGVARGLYGNSIIGALRASGQAGRRSDLLRVIGRAREIHRFNEALKQADPRQLPNLDKIPEAPHKIRRRFSYLVEVAGRDLQTGESVLRNVTVASNELMRPQRVAELAEDNVISERDRYALDVERVQTVGLMKAGPAGLI